MFLRRALIPLAAVLIAVGCSDQRHPFAVQLPPIPTPHFLQWAGSTPPQFTAGGGFVGLASLSDGLSLDHNTASFWAVRGESRSVQINYRSFTGDTTSPFLHLTITDPISVPGLGDLAPGDSVLITVTIDTVNIGVSLEPTGLQFGDPAQLQIWYAGAGGDLNGDGVADSTDAGIEGKLLGMWYREGATSTWTPIPAIHSLSDKSFISELFHFCDFEVSFSEWAVSW